MKQGQAMQRAMAAGALLIAGGMLLFLARITKATQAALNGESTGAPDEQVVAAAPPAPHPSPSGVIHVQEGDPLPPATPLVRPTGKPSATPPAASRNPGEMSREELIQEVASLRAQVARMEAQEAAVRAALRDSAGAK